LDVTGHGVDAHQGGKMKEFSQIGHFLLDI